MKEGTVLVVDDDHSLLLLIKETLKNYHVYCAPTLGEAKELLEKHLSEIEAIILDVHLPDGDGLRWLSHLTENPLTENLPCLMLSGDQAISGKVMAFTAGAEDYIVKPFDPIELRARLFSKLKKKRKLNEDTTYSEIGDLRLDYFRARAFRQTSSGELKDLGLTKKEFQLLGFLCRRLESVFSREFLLEHVWEGVSVSDRTIDSHIAHLRKKLKATSIEIETLKGMGYLARQS